MKVERALAAIDGMLASNNIVMDLAAQRLNAATTANTESAGSPVSFASAMRSIAKGGPDLNANCP